MQQFAGVTARTFPMMLAILALLGCFAASLSALAEEYRHGDLVIGDPWTRPTPGGSKIGAAYLSIHNSGKAADKLLQVASPAADRTELHEDIREGNVMGMREVKDLVIPPGKTVTFAPGGYHLMLFGLKHGLQEGQTLPLELRFAKAGEVTVMAKVQRNAPESNPASLGHS